MGERAMILLENFEEYFSLANEAFDRQKFNSAATLFFKAIVALCDLYILKHEGFVPTSHTHRFRILQEKFSNLYQIVDRDFPFYQDSYTKKINEEAAGLLKDDAIYLKKMLEL